MGGTIINVICSILVLATNVVINLVLSPIIVETIGVEANGFVTLANNCVTYAQLITTALNGMAARFVTIEYARGNYEKANLYYNSVFWGNLILVLILLVPAAFCIVRLELIFDVPGNILIDVKLLFGFVFANFLIATGLPKWDCGPFAVNRLDRSYIAQTVGMVARCIVVFSMFAMMVPHVWYVGIAATVMTAITLAANAHNTHVLTPELKIGVRKGRRSFSARTIKELLFSGVWNSIQSVGNMLTNGLDILVANLFLGATAMGSISLSKTMQTLMTQLSGSICNALAPELTIDWAKGDHERLMSNIERAMKLTACIMTVPLVGIIVFSDWFYALWVPSQDAELLWILTILSVFGYVFTSGVQILYNVFTALNKVRTNAIAVLVSGVVSIAITLVLVRTTTLGMFAIVGVSSGVNVIRNLCFMLPVTARYLGCKWYRFYPQVIRSVITVVALIAIGFAVKMLLPGESWALLVAATAAYALIGFTFNFVFLLTKDERSALFNKLQHKVKRAKN